MNKFKVGDRVIDEYLGAGEVVEVLGKLIPGDTAYNVMFDRDPPEQFNLSYNPATSFEWNLSAEK